MTQDTTAYVVIITIELLISHADSLKSKRRVISSIKDRIRTKFNASVAEIAYLEEWQRSLIGVSMISNNKRQLERGVRSINHLFEQIRDIQILNVEMEWL